MSMDVRRKRLLYQSQHRGMHEADLILGGFAVRYLETLTDVELSDFESLMDHYDGDIMNWIYGHTPVPAESDTPLFRKILNYAETAA